VHDGHRNEHPSQTFDLSRANEPPDDLGSVNFIAMDASRHHHARTRLSPTQNVNPDTYSFICGVTAHFEVDQPAVTGLNQLTVDHKCLAFFHTRSSRSIQTRTEEKNG